MFSYAEGPQLELLPSQPRQWKDSITKLLQMQHALSKRKSTSNKYEIKSALMKPMMQLAQHVPAQPHDPAGIFWLLRLPQPQGYQVQWGGESYWKGICFGPICDNQQPQAHYILKQAARKGVCRQPLSWNKEYNSLNLDMNPLKNH